MATLIKTIKDKTTGDTILPRTRSTAVTMSDGTTTLDAKLNVLSSK